MNIKRMSVLTGVLVLSAFIGCTKSEPIDTIKVSGTVKVDGQPMAGINVTFNPASGNGISAGGITDANGKYTLTSGANTPGTGAVDGRFIPTFSKTETEAREPTASPEEEIAKYGYAPPKTIYLIPEKYGDVKSCGFEAVTVEKGKPNVFDFDISTK